MSKAVTILDAIYSFFAWMGNGILRFPSKFFYVVLVILCVLAPLFSIFVVITLLCAIYRGDKEWPQ